MIRVHAPGKLCGDRTMPKQNEWIFDAIWELSDRSYDAGLPDLAGKLEEAMDTYLAEHQLTKLPRKHVAEPGLSRHRVKKRQTVQARTKLRREMREALGKDSGKIRLRIKPPAKNPVLLTSEFRTGLNATA